jgi:hypothetical protein
LRNPIAAAVILASVRPDDEAAGENRGEEPVNITVQWPRFLLASIVGAVVVFIFALVWHGHVVAGLYEGFPLRPAAERAGLMPFLFLAFLGQLTIFCYMYLRVYPQRSLPNALKFGAWAGFFTMLPNGQYFVGTPGWSWTLLIVMFVQGIAAMMLLMAIFQTIYRPTDESWTPPQVDLPRFLVCGILSAILVFVLDISFHQGLAQKLFAEYPAHDYPRRAPDESAGLMWELVLTYLFQLSIFCYLFLRIYPQRGMGNALWFGAWLGFWVLFPNMQFMVTIDKYTWRMLIIQIPEAMILTMIMMPFFEWAYRPKKHAAALSPAQ